MAVSGAIVQMVGHGLTTGLLFLLVGVLYERRHTREMADYGGVAARVPVTTTLFLIAALGSAGLPGLNGFVGEFLILGGVFQVNVLWCAVAATGMILGAVYLLTLVQKVFWGPDLVPENRDADRHQRLGARRRPPDDRPRRHPRRLSAPSSSSER